MQMNRSGMKHFARSTIDQRDDKMIAWKIVERNWDGEFKSLFHGTEGSRILQIGVWLKAEKKTVRDGTGRTRYISGFHVFKTQKLAKKYFERFQYTDNRIIIKVETKRTRLKPTNPEVLLADEIRI